MLPLCALEQLSWYATTIFIFILFLIIFLITLIVAIVKYKKTHSKLVLKITIPIMIFSALMMYQVIPARLAADTYAYEKIYFNSKTQENKNKVIKEYKKTIFLSMVPFQKADLNLRLARFIANEDGETVKLEKYYKKAKKYDKNYKHSAWSWFGLYFCLNNKFDKAIEFYKFKNDKNMLITCYILNKDFETALEYLNNAISEKHSANLYVKRSYVYEQLGKNDLAKADLENALEIENKSIKFEDERQKAFATTLGIEKSKRKYPFDYSKRAYILKKLGKIQEAQKDYEIALSRCENEQEKQKVMSEYNNEFIDTELKRLNSLMYMQYGQCFAEM